MTDRYNYLKKRNGYIKRHLPALLGVVVLLAVVGVIIGLQHKSSLLPKALAKQISFVVYYPDASWSVAPSSQAFNAKAGVLTLTAVKNNTKLTVSEQATPSQFNDIATYYPALLTKLNDYQSIGSVNGTAHLTHPVELGGQVEAVLNNDGTLMFVHPNSNLTSNTWRDFFNNLRIIK